MAYCKCKCVIVFIDAIRKLQEVICEVNTLNIYWKKIELLIYFWCRGLPFQFPWSFVDFSLISHLILLIAGILRCFWCVHDLMRSRHCFCLKIAQQSNCKIRRYLVIENIIYLSFYFICLYTGCPEKSISNLKCSYSKKYKINSNKIFTVVKIFQCRDLEVFIN